MPLYTVEDRKIKGTSGVDILMNYELLQQMTNFSDREIDTSLTTAIKVFVEYPRSEEDCKKFTHELRDFAVHTAGVSSFIMKVFEIMIGPDRDPAYPPPRVSIEEWTNQWKITPLDMIGSES